MPNGEPGGPDSEVFYRFDNFQHDPKWGEKCHPNCNVAAMLNWATRCLWNTLKPKPALKNYQIEMSITVAARTYYPASINSPDIFQTSLLKPIITRLKQLSGKNYDNHAENMRIIADHLRGATFLAVDGVDRAIKPKAMSMRRLLRRAIRYAFELGIEQNFLEVVIPVIADLYHEDYPEVASSRAASY